MPRLASRFHSSRLLIPVLCAAFPLQSVCAPSDAMRLERVSGDGQSVRSDPNGFQATFGEVVVRLSGATSALTKVDVRCSAPTMVSCTLDGAHDHVTVLVDWTGYARVARPSFSLRDPFGTDGRVDFTVPNSNARATFALHILPAPMVSLDVIKTYAPLIYLHPDEEYLPSSIDEFFAHVHLECDGHTFGLKTVWQITAADMPDEHMGADSEHYRDARCRFTTNVPMNGPYDKQPFFGGRTPASNRPVPVYVDAYDIKSATTFTAQYTTFYPWNEGKSSCPGLAPLDHCIGTRYMVDDHVGDWEMTTIQFADGKPIAVHVGAHGNEEPGMASTYFAPDWGDLKWQGTHPIEYSAAGSHGIWATEGTHNYKTLPTGDQLNDHTEKGTPDKQKPWETWRSIVLFGPYVEPKYRFLLNQFRGDWGLPPGKRPLRLRRAAGCGLPSSPHPCRRTLPVERWAGAVA